VRIGGHVRAVLRVRLPTTARPYLAPGRELSVLGVPCEYRTPLGAGR
jgi:hypothetical protein